MWCFTCQSFGELFFFLMLFWMIVYTHMKPTNRCLVVLLMPLLLLPGTCHRGDAWLHHHRLSGVNGTLKLRNHLSILLSAVFCDDCPPTPIYFSFVLVTPPPPFVTLYFAFYLPIIGNPFIKTHKNESGGSTVSNGAVNVSHASRHKILARPSHWPPSESEEVYLNTPFMMVLFKSSRRKFWAFSLSNTFFVAPLKACLP